MGAEAGGRHRPGSPVPPMDAVVLGGSALFVLLLGGLHLVRPDLDPGMHFISEYETGATGWLMQLAFLALGTACLAFALARWARLRSIPGTLGLLLLMVSAGGMLLAAFMPPGPTPGLHDLGAMLDMVPLAALLVAARLTGDDHWRHRRVLLWALSLLPLAGFLLYVGAMAKVLPGLAWDPRIGVPAGWQNRAMILAQVVWLLLTTWAEVGKARPSPKSED